MPIGVIANGCAIVIGGMIGTVGGHLLNKDFKEKMNMIFGCCAMAMGISTIVLMQNMPAVIFAIILGTILGMVIHLGDKINAVAVGMQKIVSRIIKNQKTGMSEEEFSSVLVTVIVMFCASGTGIYGSIVSGMTGDHSILIAKAILDIFTALIFACTLGAAVCLVAVPQAIVFLTLFYAGNLILPLTDASMIADFKACGGFIIFATGFRIIKVKMFPIADMIPAMLLVMPLSALWTNYILPFVS